MKYSNWEMKEAVKRLRDGICADFEPSYGGNTVIPPDWYMRIDPPLEAPVAAGGPRIITTDANGKDAAEVGLDTNTYLRHGR